MSWAGFKPEQIPSTIPLYPFLTDRLSPGQPVVDLGCGQGRILFELAARGFGPLTGIDINAEAIEQASGQAAGKIRFHHGDLRDTNLPEQQFRFAILQAVMTTLTTPDDRAAVLQECHRLLGRDGELYMAVFMRTDSSATMGPRYIQGEKETGERGSFLTRDTTGEVLYRAHHYERDELHGLLAEAGFAVSREQDQNFTSRSGNAVDGLLLWAEKKR